MFMLKHVSFILSICLVLSSCTTANNAVISKTSVKPAVTEPISHNTVEMRIIATGTVHFQEIEGGFWSIVADDGARYDTGELPTKFQKDGMRVKFQAKKLEGMTSTHMWGEMVEVSHIEAEK